MGGYGPLLEPHEVVSRAAKVAKPLKSSTPAKLYVYETLLQGLAQHLQDMAAALRQLIQEQHAVVGQRHLARHRHVAPTDQLHIRDRLMCGAKRTGRDQGRAVAGEAGDAVEARGLDDLSRPHAQGAESRLLRARLRSIGPTGGAAAAGTSPGTARLSDEPTTNLYGYGLHMLRVRSEPSM